MLYMSRDMQHWLPKTQTSPMTTQAAVGRTHSGSQSAVQMPRGSSGCCRIGMSRGSILCCRTDTSRDRTRWCRTDSFRLELGSRRPSSIHVFQLVSVCFGLFRFISVYFGLTKTPKLPVLLWKRNNRNKRFVSDSAETSFDSSFGCFESKLVSKDTLVSTVDAMPANISEQREGGLGSTTTKNCFFRDTLFLLNNSWAGKLSLILRITIKTMKTKTTFRPFFFFIFPHCRSNC
jgi:hypothetical protein